MIYSSQLFYLFIKALYNTSGSAKDSCSYSLFKDII